jgi:hypothetical protein
MMNDTSAALGEPISCGMDRSDPVLRVAHVARSLDAGGLERIVVDLVRVGSANRDKIRP